MRTFFYAVAGVLFSFISGCQLAETSGADGLRNTSVSRELVSNFTSREGGFEARFTFANASKTTLANADRALFFNLSPRPRLTLKTPRPGNFLNLTAHHDYWH